MQIDWRKAPEWARYCAMDEDGTWYWYENEPEPRSKDWCADGKYQNTGHSGVWWINSLQERPQ